MKKIITMVLVAALFSSCIFANVHLPKMLNGDHKSVKVGTSKCQVFVGVVAVGDAGIEAAAKAAGITKIHYVDKQIFHVLGVYIRYTIYVYGE